MELYNVRRNDMIIFLFRFRNLDVPTIIFKRVLINLFHVHCNIHIFILFLLQFFFVLRVSFIERSAKALKVLFLSIKVQTTLG